jgi:molybdopterin-guanine dinucleotide biosynthesis protein A
VPSSHPVRPPRGLVVGIFVGGASSRMGSPKGLLEVDGDPLAARLARLARALDPSEVVLVGERDEYAHLGLPMLRDGGSRGPLTGAGPLGGLVSLLEHAGPRWALALSCDLPFVSVELLRALAGAPDAAVVAPVRQGRLEPCERLEHGHFEPCQRLEHRHFEPCQRLEHGHFEPCQRLEHGHFEPLVARYCPRRTLAPAWSRLERGERSLQGLLAEVSALPFPWPRPEELDDWDTPEDVRRAQAEGRVGSREPA